MSNSYVFTSESVSEGHPDKVADQISDAVLDAMISQDKRSRVACETMVKTGVAIVAGEFENDAYQAAVEALIADRQPRVTLLGFTVNSMGYGPAAAVKLGLGFASDVHGVALEGDAVIATRSFYGSKVSAELEFPGADGVMLLLRPTVWAPAEGAGNASVTSREVAMISTPGVPLSSIAGRVSVSNQT